MHPQGPESHRVGLLTFSGKEELFIRDYVPVLGHHERSAPRSSSGGQQASWLLRPGLNQMWLGTKVWSQDIRSGKRSSLTSRWQAHRHRQILDSPHHQRKRGMVGAFSPRMLSPPSIRQLHSRAYLCVVIVLLKVYRLLSYPALRLFRYVRWIIAVQNLRVTDPAFLPLTSMTEIMLPTSPLDFVRSWPAVGRAVASWSIEFFLRTAQPVCCMPAG